MLYFWNDFSHYAAFHRFAFETKTNESYTTTMTQSSLSVYQISPDQQYKGKKLAIGS